VPVSVETHRLEAVAVDVHPAWAVVTVSDSRTSDSDAGGAWLVHRLDAAGYETVRRSLVRDREIAIRDAVRDALNDTAVDVVLVTGGTGVAPRDVTVEAVRSLLEKELPGFGEIFRALSFAEIGPAAMLSRATAGVRAGKAVFVLPGSPAALQLAMEKLVLPEIAHLLAQARRPR
jgi:molybdenum cofactor biosynthesis protein B